MEKIGIVLADDDEDFGRIPRPEPGLRSGSQVFGPLSTVPAETSNPARVSPLRRADGNTPVLCLKRVQKSRQSAPRGVSLGLASQERSQPSQESQVLALPPLPILKRTAGSASVSIGEQRDRYTPRFESVSSSLSQRESGLSTSTIPMFRPESSFDSSHAIPGSSKPAGRQVMDGLPTFEEWSGQPAKRRRVSIHRQVVNLQEPAMSELPGSYISRRESEHTCANGSEGLSPPSQFVPTSQPQLSVRNVGVPAENPDHANGITTDNG